MSVKTITGKGSLIEYTNRFAQHANYNNPGLATTVFRQSDYVDKWLNHDTRISESVKIAYMLTKIRVNYVSLHDITKLVSEEISKNLSTRLGINLSVKKSRCTNSDDWVTNKPSSNASVYICLPKRNNADRVKFKPNSIIIHVAVSPGNESQYYNTRITVFRSNLPKQRLGPLRFFSARKHATINEEVSGVLKNFSERSDNNVEVLWVD